MEIDNVLIKQALARGYCTARNRKKVLDSDLIEDMAEAVVVMLKNKIIDTILLIIKENLEGLEIEELNDILAKVIKEDIFDEL